MGTALAGAAGSVLGGIAGDAIMGEKPKQADTMMWAPSYEALWGTHQIMGQGYHDAVANLQSYYGLGSQTLGSGRSYIDNLYNNASSSISGSTGTGESSINQAYSDASSQLAQNKASGVGQVSNYLDHSIKSGETALDQMSRMLGLSVQGQAALTPDQVQSQLENTPGYQFRLQQGLSALENSASARGMLSSGNTLKAITDYGQGFAQTYFNDYLNQLGSIAGMGVSSAQKGADATASMTNANAGAIAQLGSSKMSSLSNLSSQLASSQASLAGSIANTQAGLYGQQAQQEVGLGQDIATARLGLAGYLSNATLAAMQRPVYGNQQGYVWGSGIGEYNKGGAGYN